MNWPQKRWSALFGLPQCDERGKSASNGAGRIAKGAKPAESIPVGQFGVSAL